ncbi:hypothetical protein HDU97_003377 [Phlyctochytrium planicorne]|nr:hypothetical protein HDU97_003377 [Phlyctochytrium planicorne]
MHFKFLIPTLALFCTLGHLAQASASSIETFDVPSQDLASTEEHQLERRGGVGKVLKIVGGIAGIVGGFLTFQPELSAYGAALAFFGTYTGTVGTIFSRRGEEMSLGKALVAEEPDLFLHSEEIHPDGNATDFVISGRNLTSGNAVYMEITHHHQTNEIEGMIVSTKAGLTRRAAANAQHLKFNFQILSRPRGGYDRAQLNRFAHSMASAVASHKRDTSCHGSMINEHTTWVGKVTIGTVAQLKARKVVNDCSRDPKVYGKYFEETHAPAAPRGQAAHSFLAVA